jgi:N-acetylated-alpha-linked acidic dipeptidase
MMKSINLILASFTASGLACQHDHHHYDLFHGLQYKLERRQEAAAPLALDANEAILSNSFDNVSIESWSYYYTHGLHWAGTNKSMAQWTVDRWNENGFQARLTEYCITSHSWRTPHD